MEASSWGLFSAFGFFITLIFVCGLYCILATRSLIRAIIGLELLIKAVTLLVIVTGYLNNNTALAQSFVITIIVIEVVLVVIAGGVALQIFRHNDDLDTRRLTNLRG
ncbi:MAG: NADH-quinone oxidoreductase subunit K [Candidatus Omnitrophica bacterium]|nr:NADH-quinone oxidoreductase subunit K [Candidatus Omnitrophota bacterium]